MLGNLLSCIIVRFNVAALHVFNMERMVLRNGRQKFHWAIVESLWFEVGALVEKDLGVVDDGSGMEGSSGRKLLQES